MAMNYFKLFKLFGLILLFESCNITATKQKYAFSLNDFFNQEIIKLNAKNYKLNKTIVKGDSVFSNLIVKPDWDKELAIFKQYAVIKKTQLEQYSIDSFKMDNGTYFITYRAENISQALKLIETQYNKDRSIEKITLLIQEEKSLNNYDINLTYLPQKGYDIKGEINSKISNNLDLDIHGEILENN